MRNSSSLRNREGDSLIKPFHQSEQVVPIREWLTIDGSKPQTVNEYLSVVAVDCPRIEKHLGPAVSNIQTLSAEFEEIWHRDFPEGDTGLIADSAGHCSDLLDSLRLATGWPLQTPSLDKLILTKHRSAGYRGFHTDDFSMVPNRAPELGTAERIIFNLGPETRRVAFLIKSADQQSTAPAVKTSKLSPFAIENSRPPALISTVVLAGRSSLGVLGVRFDAQRTMHLGLASVGSIAAVLTSWVSYKDQP